MSESGNNFYQQSVVEPLFETLANVDASTDVRRRAAISLGELRDAGLSNRLATFLQTEDLFLRLEVAKALLGLGDRRGQKFLLVNVLDEHGWVRRNIVEALGLYGGSEALPVLGWLENNVTWERDRARETVSAAIKRLQR